MLVPTSDRAFPTKTVTIEGHEAPSRRTPGTSQEVVLGIVAPAKHYRTLLTRAFRSIRVGEVLDLGPGDPVTLDHIVRRSPKVVLVDLDPPLVKTLVRQIRSAGCMTRVLAINVPSDESVELALLQGGVAGFVEQSSDLSDLIRAAKEVAEGRFSCTPSFVAALVCRVQSLTRGSVKGIQSLTRREREVLQLVNRGSSNKEVARVLGIEISTVKNHVHNILAKAGSPNTLLARRRSDSDGSSQASR